MAELYSGADIKLLIYIVFITSATSGMGDTNINIVIIENREDDVKREANIMFWDSIGIAADYHFISIDYNNVNKTLELCEKLESLSNVAQIDIIVDFDTKQEKPYLQNMAVSVLSVAYGSFVDKSTDSNSELNEQNIQIQPPGDITGEVIRDLAIQFKFSNAIVMYDRNIDLQSKYGSLLRNLPIRHILMGFKIQETTANVQFQIRRLRETDMNTYIFAVNAETMAAMLEAVETCEMFSRGFAYYAIVKDGNEPDLKCKSCALLVVKPVINQSAMDMYQSKFSTPNTNNSNEFIKMDTIFEFDMFTIFLTAVSNMKINGQWPLNIIEEAKCNSENRNHPTANFVSNFDVQLSKLSKNYPGIYGNYIYNSANKNMYMNLSMETAILNKTGGKVRRSTVGSWIAEPQTRQERIEINTSMANFFPTTVYQVAVILKPPFVYKIKDSKGGFTYDGYCIDVLKELKKLMDFEYNIYDAPGNIFGRCLANGTCTGVMGELVTKRAHIGLGQIFVLSDREQIVDFTMPFYDLIGMRILMKKTVAETSLFRFLTVMEPTVWGSILLAYLVTSLLLWLIDRFSPFSYQNNKAKFAQDPDRREFNLKECLWFCITSLTPQGGGDAPKNISGRLVAATWWLFSFIVIASYTANLAAFLTVSRLDSPIDSLDELANQFKIQYAPVNNSAAKDYFERMAAIEAKFFDKWNEMTMNENITEEDRAEFCVYDYPVGDKRTKMWQAMQETGFPDTIEDGIKKIRQSAGSFALVADSTDVRYAVMSSCDLVAVGEEFSRRPMGIAVQKRSRLKESLSTSILTLQNKRQLEALKDKWWNNNPYVKECDEQDTSSDGISIKNIGGVFIVIFAGMVIAWLILALEYCWYRIYKHDINKINAITTNDSNQFQTKTLFNKTLHQRITVVSQSVPTKQYFYTT